MSEALQYLRESSLVIALTGERTIDVSQLQFRFNVTQAVIQTPHAADIAIYNLSRDTAKLINQARTTVTLKAGYQGRSGQIFTGTIIQTRDGRENPTDTVLSILAVDSDIPYNNAITNTSLAAGWRADDLHAAHLAAMAPYGITQGDKPTLDPSVFPRGRVCFGMSRDGFAGLAASNQCDWSLSEGRLDFIPFERATGGEAIVLTSETGLIGLPVQTLDGVVFRCLLNPKIRRGAAVKLDNASIQAAPFDPSIAGGVRNASIPALQTDGFYKIVAVNHIGDTRGQAWYSDVVAQSIDPTAGLGNVILQTVDNRND